MERDVEESAGREGAVRASDICRFKKMVGKGWLVNPQKQRGESGERVKEERWWGERGRGRALSKYSASENYAGVESRQAG